MCCFNIIICYTRLYRKDYNGYSRVYIYIYILRQRQLSDKVEDNLNYGFYIRASIIMVSFSSEIRMSPNPRVRSVASRSTL
jgi:hypothetical protein